MPYLLDPWTLTYTRNTIEIQSHEYNRVAHDIEISKWYRDVRNSRSGNHSIACQAVRVVHIIKQLGLARAKSHTAEVARTRPRVATPTSSLTWESITYHVSLQVRAVVSALVGDVSVYE